MDSDVTDSTVGVTAENIGGIDHTEVTFDAGVTVLTGRNATNRTSFLQALMAGLGSERVSLKADADEGRVALRLGDQEYTRTLERQGETVVFGGDPYLDDPVVADLFAFLLGSNETRRTVALGGDLRDIIMEPVDADAIQAEIAQLQAERTDLQDRIADLDERTGRLAELQEQRDDLDERIEARQADLDAARADLDERATDAQQARSEQSELETRMRSRQQTRSELETTEFRLDSERESLDSLDEQRSDLEAKLADIDEETGDLSEIESEIDRLRERKQRLDAELSKLQNVIQFNEEMLDGASRDIAAALRGDTNSLTDQLTAADSVVCWTCGTEVEQAAIEETLDRLRDLRQSKYSEQREVDDELADRKAERSAIERTRTRRAELEEELADVRDEIDTREKRIEELDTERDRLQSALDSLDEAIADLEAQDRSDVLDLHREVTELEAEIDRLETERERVTDEIEEVEDAIERRERLEARAESIGEQLADLRTRIDRIEADAVETFNDHMADVLDRLDYDNIDRIWVERIEREVRDGRRTDTETAFRLHVVRSTDEGLTYEDDFEHLSESEREVTGLVFALAGYLAHDVHEDVPFVLLDSLEAIDADRIAALVEYMAAYADSLVVALLPEDAQALPEEYQRVTEI
jgi:DNA repair exonuclease SbcCD ATPase subunit